MLSDFLGWAEYRLEVLNDLVSAPYPEFAGTSVSSPKGRCLCGDRAHGIRYRNRGNILPANTITVD
jgi:hypothetical protein